MATFAPGVEQWRPLVKKYKGDLPEDFLMASIEEESGGNICATGIPNVEAGLFQTFHPSDDRFGATFDQLRAMCSGQSVIRQPTQEEMELHVISGVNLTNSLRERARQALAAVGLAWSENSTDFWNFVKLGHGLPAMQTDLLRQITFSMGRAPSSWKEFRDITMGMDPSQFPQSLVGFASAPSTRGRRNRIEDVFANAEHAGQYGGLFQRVGGWSTVAVGAVALLIGGSLFGWWKRRKDERIALPLLSGSDDLPERLPAHRAKQLLREMLVDPDPAALDVAQDFALEQEIKLSELAREPKDGSPKWGPTSGIFNLSPEALKHPHKSVTLADDRVTWNMKYDPRRELCKVEFNAFIGSERVGGAASEIDAGDSREFVQEYQGSQDYCTRAATADAWAIAKLLKQINRDTPRAFMPPNVRLGRAEDAIKQALDQDNSQPEELYGLGAGSLPPGGAFLVEDAARAVSKSKRFGDRKVFVSDVYEEFVSQNPEIDIDLEDFKRELARMHRDGNVEMARADLVAAMPAGKVAASEVRRDGTTFHFVTLDGANSGQPTSSARSDDYYVPPLRDYIVRTRAGERHWQAESEQHAREQHEDAFPDERIRSIELGGVTDDAKGLTSKWWNDELEGLDVPARDYSKAEAEQEVLRLISTGDIDDMEIAQDLALQHEIKLSELTTYNTNRNTGSFIIDGEKNNPWENVSVVWRINGVRNGECKATFNVNAYGKRVGGAGWKVARGEAEVFEATYGTHSDDTCRRYATSEAWGIAKAIKPTLPELRRAWQKPTTPEEHEAIFKGAESVIRRALDQDNSKPEELFGLGSDDYRSSKPKQPVSRYRELMEESDPASMEIIEDMAMEDGFKLTDVGGDRTQHGSFQLGPREPLQEPDNPQSLPMSWVGWSAPQFVIRDLKKIKGRWQIVAADGAVIRTPTINADGAGYQYKRDAQAAMDKIGTEYGERSDLDRPVTRSYDLNVMWHRWQGSDGKARGFSVTKHDLPVLKRSHYGTWQQARSAAARDAWAVTKALKELQARNPNADQTAVWATIRHALTSSDRAPADLFGLGKRSIFDSSKSWQTARDKLKSAALKGDMPEQNYRVAYNLVTKRGTLRQIVDAPRALTLAEAEKWRRKWKNENAWIETMDGTHVPVKGAMRPPKFVDDARPGDVHWTLTTGYAKPK